MMLSLCFRYNLVLIGALLIVACQPPAASISHSAADNDDETAQTAIIIDADSVTMSQEDILTIKPSRYQPSLGLQGRLEPMQQVRFVAGNALVVKKLLVTQGQIVAENDPLFIVQRQIAPTTTTDNHVTNNQINAQANSSPIDSAAGTDNKLEVATDKPNLAKTNNEPNNKPELTTTKNTDNTHLPSQNNTLEKNNALEKNKASADSNSSINGNANNSPNNSTNNDAKSSSDSNEKEESNESNDNILITVRAPFAGRVDNLYIKELQHIVARAPLLHLKDEIDLRFIATLPIQAEPQLSIGQTVNFTVDSLISKFTGQVSKLIKGSNTGDLLVYVNVVNNDVSRGALKPDMLVTGRVDYGQIEVGTIVPESAIQDADLTELQKQPYKPLSPLKAQVWIIQQNQRLARQQVDVISFDPSTGQYLIAGVNNDSLICLASLPLSAVGKKVIVS